MVYMADSKGLRGAQGAQKDSLPSYGFYQEQLYQSQFPSLSLFSKMTMMPQNGRHVNGSGQLEEELIGQSGAAMAVWHDLMGQSTKIYRALQGC